MLKWQQSIIDSLEKFSDKELVDEIVTLANGDDYDGCFTDRGWWELDTLRDELLKRLAKKDKDNK